MSDRQLLQRALSALERAERDGHWTIEAAATVDAIRARLEQPEPASKDDMRVYQDIADNYAASTGLLRECMPYLPGALSRRVMAQLYAKMPANNGANKTVTTEQVTEKVIHDTVRRLAMQMAQQTGVLLTTIDLDWRIAYRVGDESIVDLGEVRVTTKSAQ